ncbi:DNA repair protein RecN [Aliikangiella coralliicola]|uniref:DNA repair protein RecN n=1 Tax=Aliikangiella coralliicola TaxID=2592383 RepID=A0A545UGP7_9GAMM|nr:DNA repair protein RecN [Aliikangiella coralliicola]TQV88637.1 DNA repair protein RecN [Aliikangiella coralliicola]
MLSRIEIRNFAIIQCLDLDWSSGMTVITGETGAGKSIVIDALGLTLGERADQAVIYPQAKQAEVTALFDLDENSYASQWLVEQGLDEEGECILRRVVVREGRSKCFINGRSVTQSQLKSLGSLLIDIHGQHAHQSLLKSKEQLNLLDRYAAHPDLLNAVKKSAHTLKQLQQRKLTLEDEKQARDAKRDLLIYQVEELNEANPEQATLDSLEQEHKQAATSQERLQLVEESAQWLHENDSSSALSAVARVNDQIAQLKTMDEGVDNLNEILIQVESLLQEAKAELSDYRNNLNCDPEKLYELDQQLGQFHDLARKHHVSLEQLPAHFKSLQEELEQLEADDNELDKIELEYQKALNDYLKKSGKLTKSRQKTANKLQRLVTEKIQGLAMEGGKLEIQLTSTENTHSSVGVDSVDFLVSANPGQPLQPLNKVASGGELSRISLAISVITAEQQLVPSIIFDEVDVGIGGGTAETVGNLLNQLAQKRQVICVTHQPQVAACGDNHLVASKTKQLNSTTTKMTLLDEQQRIDEIGRMLGGLVVSEKTLLHAKEMLGV